MQSQAGPILVSTSQVDFGTFLISDYQRQQENEWCWAACVSMVFSFYGHPVSQSRIVSTVYGAPIDAPAASGSYIEGVLNREWVDDNGKHFKSTVKAAYDIDTRNLTSLNNDMLIAQLAKGNPVVIGAGSHAMVLTSMQYTRNLMGTIVLQAGVFDPWPGVGPRLLNESEKRTYNNGGSFRFAATIKIEDIKNDGSTADSASTSSSTVTHDSTTSGQWEDEGADSSDIDIHTATDWGDKHSGKATVTVRIKNTSENDSYKVEVKVAVVKKDRTTKDITGEVDSKTRSTIVAPNSSRSMTYILNWATSDWQPNAEEMPAIARPESDTDYSSIHIWKKSQSD